MGTVFAALFAGSLSGEALLAVYLSATSEKKLGSSSRTRNFVALATVSQYGIHDDLDQLTTGDQMKFDLVLLLEQFAGLTAHAQTFTGLFVFVLTSFYFCNIKSPKDRAEDVPSKSSDCYVPTSR